MNNELMRDVNFIRCSTMIAELLMKYKSMETEEDQEGWMQEGASSPLLFLLRLLKSFLSSFIRRYRPWKMHTYIHVFQP